MFKKNIILIIGKNKNMKLFEKSIKLYDTLGVESQNRAVKIYLNSNLSQEKVAEMFEINIRTLQRWITHYQQDESLERKNII